MEITNSPNPPHLLHFFFLLLLITNSPSAAANIADDFNHTAKGAPPSCHGGGSSISECSQLDLEMGMESETTTRLLLPARKYITPPALKPDQPVCNGGGRGESYSRGGGCLPEPSNPYNRGCRKYYRCRNDD